MEIYYFKNEKFMKMEVDDENLVIKSMLKIDPKYGSTTFRIGYYSDKPLFSMKARAKDKFKFYPFTVTYLGGETFNKSSWRLDGLEQFESTLDEDAKSAWIYFRDRSIDFWIDRFCKPSFLLLYPGYNHLGHTLYYSNVELGQYGMLSNCAIHLFGNNTAKPAFLDNVILYVHGKLDIQ